MFSSFFLLRLSPLFFFTSDVYCIWIRDVLSLYSFHFSSWSINVVHYCFEMYKHRNVLVELLKTCNIKRTEYSLIFASAMRINHANFLFFRSLVVIAVVHTYSLKHTLDFCHARKSLFHFNLGFILRKFTSRKHINSSSTCLLLYFIILVVIFDKAV